MKMESQSAALSVSELTDVLRRQLEERFDWVQVRGEISGFKKAPSGHAYFRLKDAEAVLECVAWKATVVRWSGLDLQDGAEVVVGGKITVYPPRGQYQLVVSAIRLAGAGALQLKFEALKRKLSEEGLFDAERKKPIPAFPRRIAVITSPSGAAVHDFLRVVREGNCPVDCVICPVLVQGADAPGEIAEMLGLVNRLGGFDLIVLCRGGGSLEDLWAFNEEIVARAIFVSEIPVVSAVGHEIDFTIADFTADVRAPTPTAAGQLIGRIFETHRNRLHLLGDRFLRLTLLSIERERERLEVTRQALRRYHPIAVVAQQRQRLDERMTAMLRAMRSHIQRARADCRLSRDILARSIGNELNRRSLALRSCEHLLDSYNPLRNLSRGYAICRHRDGRYVGRIADVKTDDIIDVVVSDGSFGAQVLDKDARL